MRRKQKFVLVVALTFLLISMSACASGGRAETSPPMSAPSPQEERPHASPDVSPSPLQLSEGDTGSSMLVVLSGEVIVTFDYQKQSGSASNQYAVWVEDMDGNYINTLFATQWTASGGHQSRPDSIALWVEKSDIASMPDYYVDAISGANPRTSGSQSYAWNLKNINGDTVSHGEYRVFVEGTLRWKNYVLYTGVITIGDAPVTIQADAEYVYEASDRYDALTGESSENTMIGAVTVSFVPVAAN